jgi:hypothetical protein
MAKRARKGKRPPPSPAARAAEACAAAATALATEAAVDRVPEAGRHAERAQSPLAGSAWSTALIALFLLFQLAMPLRYYLGGRGTDERFSWRMFSSVRMQRCKVRVRERANEGSELRDVALNRELHVAWIGMLERNRPQVVEKLLVRRCEAADIAEALLTRNCVDTSGDALPELEVKLDCKRGEFLRRGGERGAP